MVLRNSLILLISLLLPAAAFAADKYTVKKGDNLYDLSRKFGVSVDDIKSTNNLSDARLDIGDVLIIPGADSAGNAVDTRSTVNNQDGSNNKEYVVRKGDTLGEIAEKYGLTSSDLQSENGLKTTKLKIGQKLLIPSGQGSIEKSDVTVTSSVKTTETGTVSAPVRKNTVYTVKSGDTLGHIAAGYGLSSRELKTANGLKSDRLSIGQALVIPSGASESAAQAAAVSVKEEPAQNPAPVTASVTDGFYTVKKGDTPGGIAAKLGISTRDLIKLNNINSKSLQIGQRLAIPGIARPETAAVKAEAPARAENAEQAAAAKPAPAPAVEYSEYVVKKGDTPGGIAARLGVSTARLIELNNIDSKSLQIGQKLLVPGPGTQAAVTADSQAKSEPAVPSEYTVRKGDTLYELSGKFGVSVDFIKKNNNIKNNNLRIGQKLALTKPAAVTADSGADAVTESVEVIDVEVTSKYTGSYTVKRGDTLGQLALKYGVSRSELKKMNGLKGDGIRTGQKLLVPEQVKEEAVVVVETETVPEAAPVPAPEAAPATGEIYIKKRYVVKEGDTLGSIAASFGVSVDEVKKASALKTDEIGKGNTLLIPVPQEKVTSSQYVVAKGDTLGKLSRRFGVSVSELKKANGIKGSTLRTGMRLNIPGITPAPAEPAMEVDSAVVASSSTNAEYVVRKGETLSSIAAKYGVTVTELKKENNIKSSTVRSGQVLYIPGGAKIQAAYLAVTEKNTIMNSNGKLSPSKAQEQEAEVKNGRFSKESIIQVAKKYLGAPYKFGGYDFITGIDCSGYVKKVFSRFNVTLPRTARDIYYRSGESVKKTDLDSGDLVFFTTYAKYPSHVGIYIGNDEFIHASSASRKVTIDSINKQYYRKRYIGAKRVQLSGLFYDEMTREFSGFEKN